MRENCCDFVEIDGDLDQDLEEEMGGSDWRTYWRIDECNYEGRDVV